MIPKEDFTCPRCDYKTHHKATMRNHLYKRQSPCPATKNDLELTDSIKEYILANKIYKVRKQKTPQQINIQNIINNNQINNFVTKMDTFQKLGAYLEQTQTTIIPLEDQIEDKYEHNLLKCEDISTQLREFSLNNCEILKILDTLTTSSSVDTLNVVYDKTPNKLSIYDGEWETHVFEHGVKELLEKIQLFYLDSYEELLLDKIAEDPNYIEKQRAQELLKEYYTFLVSFEIKPFLTRGTTDKMIDYNEQYYNFYSKTRDNVKFTEVKELKRSVYNMIKTNCIASITELNKRMMDIICTDEAFKNKVLQMLQNKT